MTTDFGQIFYLFKRFWNEQIYLEEVGLSKALNESD